MRKIILILTVILLAVSAACAQNRRYSNPDNKAYFGLRLGVDITCPGATQFKRDNHTRDMFKNGPGVEFGGIYHIPIVANLYVEPGLKLYYDTYSMKKDYWPTYVKLWGVSIRKFGARIPFNLGYHFDFSNNMKLNIFTGAEFEMGITANTKYSGPDFDKSQNLYRSDGLKRENLLWNLGLGFSYEHIYIEVKRGIGLLNIDREKNYRFKEGHFTISLGYNFKF